MNQKGKTRAQKAAELFSVATGAIDARASRAAKDREITKPIPISAITADLKAQPRARIDPDTVQDYREAMLRGDDFPPVIVFADGGGARYYLADGWHRMDAAKGAGKKQLLATVKTGGLREAILYSCGANDKHGLRRTIEDKARAVTTLLDDPEWSKWSNMELARMAGVSEGMIRKHRDAMIYPATPNDARRNPTAPNDVKKRVKRGGTEYNMSVNKIGQHTMAGYTGDEDTKTKSENDIPPEIDTVIEHIEGVIKAVEKSDKWVKEYAIQLLETAKKDLRTMLRGD